MRTILLGQAPSAESDPERPLGPDGASGRRLARLVGPAFEEAFELRNLLRAFPGKLAKGDAFPKTEARLAAAATIARLRGRRVVFLGRNVAEAFGFSWPEPLEWHQHVGFAAARLPHPSGINTWWNDQKNVRAAAAFLRAEAERSCACRGMLSIA